MGLDKKFNKDMRFSILFYTFAFHIFRVLYTKCKV